MTPYRTTRPFLLVAGLLLLSCDSSTAPEGPPPVLSVPIVDLSTVKRFIPFGAILPGSSIPDLSGEGVKNPAYEFVVTGTDTEVRAATAGTVTGVHPQIRGDFELHIRPPNAGSYLIIYDHVLDVRVTVGSVVQPGDVLGLVGEWSATEGRVELQINRGQLSVCPRDLGTAAFNAAHDAALAAADPSQQEPEWTDVCLQATVAH